MSESDPSLLLAHVRAIARDLGGVLGCLGHVQRLRRVWSGPFDVGGAIPFDRVDRAAQAELDAALLPVQSALDLPEMRATASTSPLGTDPSRSAATTCGAHRTNPRAVAARTVGCLSVTSTMRA